VNKYIEEHTVDAMELLARDEANDPELAKGIAREYAKLEIGYQILCAREDAGLTQAQLAERIGTSQPAIARIEQGDQHRISMTTLLKIAEALGLALQIHLVKPFHVRYMEEKAAKEAKAKKRLARTLRIGSRESARLAEE
jgi:transcriptional regulator with XRE-family HTH domain